MEQCYSNHENRRIWPNMHLAPDLKKEEKKNLEQFLLAARFRMHLCILRIALLISSVVLLLPIGCIARASLGASTVAIGVGSDLTPALCLVRAILIHLSMRATNSFITPHSMKLTNSDQRVWQFHHLVFMGRIGLHLYPCPVDYLKQHRYCCDRSLRGQYDL